MTSEQTASLSDLIRKTITDSTLDVNRKVLNVYAIMARPPGSDIVFEAWDGKFLGAWNMVELVKLKDSPCELRDLIESRIKDQVGL